MLTSNEGVLGVRSNELLIQQSDFKTHQGADPSVRLVLRLINTEVRYLKVISKY